MAMEGGLREIGEKGRRSKKGELRKKRSRTLANFYTNDHEGSGKMTQH